MSDRSNPTSKSKSRVPWLSRFKKRISSGITPSSHAARQKLPAHHADTDVSPTSTSDHPSTSSVPIPSTTNRAGADSTLGPEHPTCHAEDLTSQLPSSGNVAPPAPSEPPQGQALRYQGSNQMFSGAHNFTVRDSTFIESNTTADNFMKELLQETIIGAEFDSSDRDPPPRCHPGTRLAIIQRCLDFIAQCHDEGKLRWVVGPAGVGKSAVMQMVTETAPDGILFASIFLSVNGRRDGKKTIITIAYQLAVKSLTYHQFIRDLITRDPSLLRKSLPVQFKKFIIEPFMHKSVFDPSLRYFIVIDGLDECDDPLTQHVLLELITGFCITYPTSPIAWLVASRPEPHITSFFDMPQVQPVYTKEEIVIDSDEACEEVQRYLRDELKKIKFAHATLRYKREWPLEHEFTKIASAAGGLFAYAATVIRYIHDSIHGGPAAQLRRVLETIDASVRDHVVGRDNPMDLLDALYKRILSNIPDNVMTNTRKLLLLYSDSDFRGAGFRGMCNALRLTEDDAYDAIDYLHAVMKIPGPEKADDQLSYYHKSFGDFLSDFERSGFSDSFNSESLQFCNETSMKIIEDLQDDSNRVAGGADIEIWRGHVKGGCEAIRLSWPGDERFQRTDEKMRTMLYTAAMRSVHAAFQDGDKLLIKSISCFHALTMRFTMSTFCFPFYRLRDSAFDCVRDELANLGKLKHVPLQTFDYAAICGNIELRFTSPTRSNIEVSDPWDTSCEHTKKRLDGVEQQQGWSTDFQRYHQVDLGTEADEDADIPRFHVVALHEGHREWVQDHTNGSRDAAAACIHCSRHFARIFMDNADQLATVFVDSTEMCYVEFSFVDPDDGVSEWRYRFLHSGRPTDSDASY